jgi:hypothetical protein
VLFLLPSRKPAGVVTPAPNVVSETPQHVEARA